MLDGEGRLVQATKVGQLEEWLETEDSESITDFALHKSDPNYSEALKAIRSMRCAVGVLRHVDWVAAPSQKKVGRLKCPLTLVIMVGVRLFCQGFEGARSAQVLSTIATDVQQLWSAMARELHALS